jgi:hypothetical protein
MSNVDLSEDLYGFYDLHGESTPSETKSRKLKKLARATLEDSALCTWIFRPKYREGSA